MGNRSTRPKPPAHPKLGASYHLQVDTTVNFVDLRDPLKGLLCKYFIRHYNAVTRKQRLTIMTLHIRDPHQVRIISPMFEKTQQFEIKNGLLDEIILFILHAIDFASDNALCEKKRFIWNEHDILHYPEVERLYPGIGSIWARIRDGLSQKVISRGYNPDDN